ncbi:MAG: hypothetical protein EBX41_00125, partial [Chitinophagia bacterium]|nr:hypothetical protein [Chitinophagia bacterium]
MLLRYKMEKIKRSAFSLCRIVSIAGCLIAGLHYCGFAKQVTETKIVKDTTPQKLLMYSYRAAFDTLGNYYFETPLTDKGDKYIVFTNKTTPQYYFWDARIAQNKTTAYITNAFFTDSAHKAIIFKNRNSTEWSKPHSGIIKNRIEIGRNNLLIELCNGNKSYLYINDSLVNITDTQNQKYMFTASPNGNLLYVLHKQNLYKLYHNHKLIDSSTHQFKDIEINNNDFYLYIKYNNNKYSIHTPSGVHGPFNSADFGDLYPTNAYFYRGCKDTLCYILINGKLYKDIPEVHTVADDGSGNLDFTSYEQITASATSENNYAFSYNRNNKDGIFVNVNGKEEYYYYQLINGLTLGSTGSFAFWGYSVTALHTETLSKNINGKELPIVAWNKATPKREKPLGIDPEGNCTYYFETRDSVYLYANDKQVGTTASKRNFATWEADALPQAENSNSCFFKGININNAGYIAYKGTLSKPFPKIITD